METLIHSFELYTKVSLNQDFPEYNLKAGDVATLIDFVPHPENKEEGVVLEIFNTLGESLNVVSIPISSIDSLKEDEIFSVRKYS
ncbi:MAG: DUF4926 domain-containing protein [Leptospiraceae bacterium]|nr:hypothetical protein [Leptospiraceae bacterium]MCP5502192.1 DUF4926 domain-containing protein [Leptospiraceae bacterium]MCP5502198.1 DUF4926 domain-containing protein [Leptospiraceae bacterium]